MLAISLVWTIAWVHQIYASSLLRDGTDHGIIRRLEDTYFTDPVAEEGEELQKELRSTTLATLESFDWLNVDNSEWKDFDAIETHGWSGKPGSSVADMIQWRVDGSALPNTLSDALTTLSPGHLGHWYKVTWELPARPNLNSKGFYETLYSPEHGIIVSMHMFDPHVHQHHSSSLVEDHWAQITYLTYSAIQKNLRSQKQAYTGITKVLVVLPAKCATTTLIEHIIPRSTWGHIKAYSSALVYRPLSRHYNVLLGSSDGRTMAKMLLERRRELGHLEIPEIRVWVPEEGKPCLLFSFAGRPTHSVASSAGRRRVNTVTNGKVLDSPVTSSASATFYKTRSGTIVLIQVLLIAIAILIQLSAALPVDSDFTALSLNAPLNALDIAEHQGSQLLDDLQSSFVNPPPETEDARELLDDWTCYSSIRDHGFSVKGEIDICKDLASPTAFGPYLRDLMITLTADQSAPWHFVTWHIEAKEHLQSKGEYSTAYNPRAGIIITITKEDPSVRYSHDVEKQEDHWPSITFLTQEMISRRTVAITPQNFRTSIKQIVMADVKGPTTSLFADLHARSTWSRLSRFADALVYTPERDPKEFKALLGSAEGLSVALMLLERRAELGRLTVSEIKVFVHNDRPILISCVAARPGLNAASGVAKKDLDADLGMVPTATRSFNKSLRYRKRFRQGRSLNRCDRE
ncbi:hypothetical protein LTR78_004908 [Recurvomyces mirabilis]|uniref:Uncharacterized protein n=1 Tax=Recurvomyces mirabilis TaxID=574656 RepID=A0AAE0WPD8_9PEZI|nr:hypothetical protein LTR78_004908 [Recurvomyces mirabilis]KAK5158078.1 hypothetical protein LTS14_004001 [Recurvomyces mirabilis]